MHRRGFLDVVIAGVQAGIACLLAVPGLRFFLSPLRRSPGKAKFERITPLATVPDEGRPVRVVVKADRWDAYVHHPPGPVGSVWLIRSDGDGGDGDNDGDAGVRCLQTICPHLGCGIDYAEGRGVFSCPCHGSDFTLSGQRLSGPSPRDMDKLETRVTQPDNQGRRWVEVRYREFEIGIPEKKPVS